MDEKTKIKVIKLSSGIVSYRMPTTRVLRKFKGENATLLIPFAELEEALYDGDIRTLFDYGYLRVDNKEARIALGLEPDEGEINSTLTILDKAGVITLLYKENTIENFMKEVKKLAPETANLLIEIATKNPKHAGSDKYDALKKHFGIDIEMARLEAREA